MGLPQIWRKRHGIRRGAYEPRRRHASLSGLLLAALVIFISSLFPFQSRWERVRPVNPPRFTAFPPPHLTHWAKAYWAKHNWGEGWYEGGFARAVRPTTDGGFIVSGINSPLVSDPWVVDSEIQIMKLTEKGQLEWQRLFNLYYAGTWYRYLTEEPRSVCETADGGFLVAVGWNGWFDHSWLLKLDRQGVQEWQRKIGLNPCAMITTFDQGFVILAKTEETGTEHGILKLDPAGNIEWLRSYRPQDQYVVTNPRSVIQARDGGYVAAGWIEWSGYEEDPWVMKVDPAGNIEWQWRYGGGRDRAYDIRQTDEGGYIVAGTTYSPGSTNTDALIIKLDAFGKVEWQRSYGSPPNNYEPRCIIQESDGGYLVAGEGRGTSYSYSDRWGLLIKLDRAGDVLWQRYYPSEMALGFVAIQPAGDGGHILLGSKDIAQVVYHIASNGYVSLFCPPSQTPEISSTLISAPPVMTSASAYPLLIAFEDSDELRPVTRPFNTETLCESVQFDLDVSASDGGTTDPPPGSYAIDEGLEVRVRAVPEPPYTFSHWSGDIKDNQKTANPMTVYMDGDKSVQAHFLRKYTLTLSASAGGTTEPAPGTYEFVAGMNADIRAIPAADYVFLGWTGDVMGTEKDSNPVRITMDRDKSIQAAFLRRIYAPLAFQGRKVLNRSLFQTEYINVLSWEPNPANTGIAKYRVFLTVGTAETLLAELGAQTFSYQHRGVGKDVEYLYALCAVDSQGREGERARVTAK